MPQVWEDGAAPARGPLPPGCLPRLWGELDPSVLTGDGGGERMAREMSAPFWGRIPMNPYLLAACDAGTPIAVGADAGASGQALGRVIEGILLQIGSRALAAAGGSCHFSERS